MLDFLHTISTAFIELLANENYANFLGVVITAILSYKAAKLTSIKPGYLNIKSQQFQKVYLPLYRLLENQSVSSNKSQAIKLQQDIAKILEDGYEFAFPQLHTLNVEFKNCIAEDRDYLIPLSAIRHQVSLDYALLRKQLGYPSESMFTIFIRMTAKQKIKYIFSWITLPMTFVPFFFFPAQFKLLKGNMAVAVIFVFIETVLTVFLMIKISSFIENLPD